MLRIVVAILEAIADMWWADHARLKIKRGGGDAPVEQQKNTCFDY
jgi:hypothetical protein